VFTRRSGGIDTCKHSQGLTPEGFWNSRQMLYLWHSCRLWYRSAWVYFFGLAQPILVRAQSRPLNFRKIKPSPALPVFSWAQPGSAQQTEDADQPGPTCLQPTLNTIHFRVLSCKKLQKCLKLKLTHQKNSNIIYTHAKCRYWKFGTFTKSHVT